MLDQSLESRIQSFELAWQREGVSALSAILDRAPTLRGAERQQLLFELIAIDLEFRARRADPGTLDEYAARFPELGTPEEWPVELIGEEYRARQGWGDRPSHATFLARFPTRHEQIRTELARVDTELAEEHGGVPEGAEPLEPTVELPLIPHHEFRLQRMIGAGRMGKVYRAWWHNQQRAVAVKFLRKMLLKEPLALARFLSEAKTVAKLQHPNIVGVHGLGRTPAGAYYLILDFVSGPNLSAMARTQSISVDHAVRDAIQLCAALEHAHEAGVVHCDLKPANILRDDDGVIRVTDFGVSRALNERAAWTAYIEGTAPFMAPEQACSSWGRIDQRTDVFGVGAVLYALLTGRPPWTGSTLPEILSMVVGDDPVPRAEQFRPDLPHALATVCATCLAKRPVDRYLTAGEVRSALLASLG